MKHVTTILLYIIRSYLVIGNGMDCNAMQALYWLKPLMCSIRAKQWDHQFRSLNNACTHYTTNRLNHSWRERSRKYFKFCKCSHNKWLLQTTEPLILLTFCYITKGTLTIWSLYFIGSSKIGFPSLVLGSFPRYPSLYLYEFNQHVEQLDSFASARKKFCK